MSLCCFDSLLNRLAVVEKSQLCIWELQTNKQIQKWSDLKITFTHLSWYPVHSASEQSDKKADLDFIFLGTSQGQIFVFDVNKSEVVMKLGGNGIGHQFSINDVCFSSNQTHIFSCSDEPNIFEWNFKTGKLISSFKGDRRAVKRICCHGEILASAFNKIKLWNLSSRTTIHKFNSTSNSSVSRLKFSPDGSFLISSSSDNFINFWLVDSEDKDPIIVLASENAPQYLDVRVKESKAKQGKAKQNVSYDILALVQTGIKFWNVQSAHLKNEGSLIQSLPKPPQGSCSGRFTLAQFTPSGFVGVASGSMISKPSFQNIEYLNEKNAIRESISLKKGTISPGPKLSTAISPSPKKNEKEKFQKSQPANPLPVPEQNNQKNIDSIQQFEQKMQIFEENFSKPATPTPFSQSKNSNQEFESTDSIQGIMLQALLSKDKTLLKKCLLTKEINTINNTVKYLPLFCLGELFDHLIARLYKNAFHSHIYIAWLQSIFAHHISYMVSQTALKPKLILLSHLISSHVENYPQLLQLSGRFALVHPQSGDSLDNLHDSDLESEEEETDGEEEEMKDNFDKEGEEEEEDDMDEDSEKEENVQVQNEKTKQENKKEIQQDQVMKDNEEPKKATKKREMKKTFNNKTKKKRNSQQ